MVIFIVEIECDIIGKVMLDRNWYIFFYYISIEVLVIW